MVSRNGNGIISALLSGVASSGGTFTMSEYWASNNRCCCTLSTNPWIHFRTRTPLGTGAPSGHTFKTGDFLKLSTNSCLTGGTKANPMFKALSKLEPNETFLAARMLCTTFGGTRKRGKGRQNRRAEIHLFFKWIEQKAKQSEQSLQEWIPKMWPLDVHYGILLGSSMRQLFFDPLYYHSAQLYLNEPTFRVAQVVSAV
ncbi:hypothetical protein NPIL_584391, partial [Nephila pilipes]